jgi:TonB family protein
MRRVIFLFGPCLCAVLAAAALAQGDKWFEASSEHFLLYTDTSEAKAQRLLADFEGRVSAFSAAFGPLRPRQFPIEVFLFKRSEDFVGAIPGGGTVQVERAAYLIHGPDRLFIVARDKSPDDIANDVGHALGHALFEHQVVWRPFWLSEGIAEYIRKVGRNPDTKAVSREDGYATEDLLTIVPSGTYQDSDPGGAFRIQSYRLLQLVLAEDNKALRDFLTVLATEEGSNAKLQIDTQALADKFSTYTEKAVSMPAVHPDIKVVAADPGKLAIHQGDLMLATNKTSPAGQFYRADTKEARAARAILTRFSRMGTEALRALDRAAHELPDFGLVQYHFGALETQSQKDIEAQIEALDRAIQLLPSLGRAYAELARVYALSGRADQALPLITRALELEPEFADHYYEIRSNVHLAQRNYDDALRDIRIAESLPHADRKVTESFGVKIMNLTKRIESARREVEGRRVDQIRNEVETKVKELEPPPKPVTPVPIPEGRITYQIEARSALEVADAVYPEYPESLRKNGVAGRIALRVDIGPDGKVKTASITESQVPDLNSATIEAVKKWVFNVAKGARATPVSIRLIFSYALQ